jgi:hypothetical protein
MLSTRFSGTPLEFLVDRTLVKPPMAPQLSFSSGLSPEFTSIRRVTDITNGVLLSYQQRQRFLYPTVTPRAPPRNLRHRCLFIGGNDVPDTGISYPNVAGVNDS